MKEGKKPTCGDGERERKGETEKLLDICLWHVEARIPQPLSDGGADEPRRRRFGWRLLDGGLLPAGVWTPRHPLPDQPTRVGAKGEGRGLCCVGERGG